MQIIKKLDPILKISFILMIISFIVSPFDKKFMLSVDFRVISLLFCLMLVIENLKETRLFDLASEYVINKFNTTRKLVIVIVVLSFVLSMFITNDVALITLVPFTVLLLKGVENKHTLIDTVILETVAANLGSQFTPIGNPQNLYIYSHYNLGMTEFLSHMLMPSIIALVLILFSTIFIKEEALNNKISDNINIDIRLLSLWTLAFVLCLLSVVRILPYIYLVIILCFISICINKKSLKNVDYGILFTFIFLFIFVNNLLNIEYIKENIIPFLKSNIYVASIIFSQFISNVPASMLFAPLSDDWKSLIYGVNVGGLGTLIASMASIISYKIYSKADGADKTCFILRFGIYNFVLLMILSIIYAILINI